MNLTDKIKNISFLTSRNIVDVGTQAGVGIIGYKDGEDDVYSSIVASPRSESGVLPHIVMICTKGSLLRLDSGSNIIHLSMCKEDGKHSFQEEFPITIGEGEFFQKTLIEDYRHVTYEYIEALLEVLDIMNDAFPENI